LFFFILYTLSIAFILSDLFCFYRVHFSNLVFTAFCGCSYFIGTNPFQALFFCAGVPDLETVCLDFHDGNPPVLSDFLLEVLTLVSRFVEPLL